MPDPLDYFLPYQVRWIRSSLPVVIAEKSRRIGWTYASSYRAVERRTLLKTNLYFSSADLSAAREFVEDCMRWARVFRIVAVDMGKQVIDEEEGLTAFVLRFENGAKIVAGSSNPKFFRSKGGDADGDEFAFHEQPRELYKAMQPAALMWGHQMRIWSTHNGEGSFFNRLLQSARQTDEGDPAGHAPELVAANGQLVAAKVGVQRVTLFDSVEQGLVEKIKRLSGPDPVARRDFIEEIRLSCPDEDSWNEEYLCQPSSEQSSLLSYELIQSCEAANLHLWDLDECGEPETLHTPPSVSLPAAAHVLYAGFDVGRKQDRSVLWVLEQIGDVFWTRMLRVLENVNFTAQEELLHGLMRNRSVRRLCIDSTGIGAMLAERLAQRWRGRVEPIHFSAPVKSELAMPLLRMFQDKLVRIPADATVREDLHKVRKVVTAANNVRLDADRDQSGHADRFWALALAHHAAEQPTRRLPPSILRKPVGW